MRSKTVVQLILFITSFVIIFTYIKPSYETLQAIQVEADEYTTALKSAEQFNFELSNQLDAANSFSPDETNALNRYMPKEIDSIAVMRDLEIIAVRNNMDIQALSSSEATIVQSAAEDEVYDDEIYEDELYDESYDEDGDGFAQGQQLKSSQAATMSMTFTLNVQGTYEDFKAMLRDLERNAYPLEITTLSFTSVSDSGEGGTNTGADDLYAYNIMVETYQLGSTE